MTRRRQPCLALIQQSLVRRGNTRGRGRGNAKLLQFVLPGADEVLDVTKVIEQRIETMSVKAPGQAEF